MHVVVEEFIGDGLKYKDLVITAVVIRVIIKNCLDYSFNLTFYRISRSQDMLDLFCLESNILLC